MSVDFFPTLVEMAGLPPCPEELSGVSLGPALRAEEGAAARRYAFSQFPRCSCTYQTPRLDARNGTCPSNYTNAWTHETGATGAANHHVCLFTPAAHFDWMGYRIRAEGWSFVLFVEWDGARLAPRWDRVQSSELYQHDADDETDFDGPYSEATNLMARPLAPAAAAALAELRPALVRHFTPP